MHTRQTSSSILDAPCSAKAAMLAIALVLIQIIGSPQPAAAQYQIIHNFTGGADGWMPLAGLTRDKAGNLYGTTSAGGNTGGDCNAIAGCGTVFRLSPNGSGWILSTLYTFQGGSDGSTPLARVIFGPDGSLYGTTSAGGIDGGCIYLGVGCGTVFKLAPPPRAPASANFNWVKTTLYTFSGGIDGAVPGYGDLVFDPSGNLYGTTIWGGTYSVGAIYELSPSAGGWVESNLPPPYGDLPMGGLAIDSDGNLYGTASAGGEHGLGTNFELTPSAGGWTENSLHDFQGGYDGASPLAALTLDTSLGGSPNIWGTTSAQGRWGGGTVFVGLWWFCCQDFSGGSLGPWATVTFHDSAYGYPYDVFGTTYADGQGYGSVWELQAACSCACEYIYHDLYDFGQTDGFPVSGLVFDGNGNLYGTASAGTIFSLHVGGFDTLIGSCRDKR